MGVDFLDYTILAKKGLLKESSENEEGSGNVDVIDFTSNFQQNQNVPYVTSASNAVSAQATDVPDFLSAFAQASANTASESVAKENNKDIGNNSSHNNLSLKIDGVVNKLDDLMYKIETLSGRIAQMESNLKEDRNSFK